MYYFLLSHSNNGYTKAPQYYVLFKFCTIFMDKMTSITGKLCRDCLTSDILLTFASTQITLLAFNFAVDKHCSLLATISLRPTNIRCQPFQASWLPYVHLFWHSKRRFRTHRVCLILTMFSFILTANGDEIPKHRSPFETRSTFLNIM